MTNTNIMTKTSIKKELKGLFNGSRKVAGFMVANVAWKSMPWMVIENDETFEDARQDKFAPIDHFLTQEDLATALLRVNKN
jgi:hypothetical protein